MSSTITSRQRDSIPFLVGRDKEIHVLHQAYQRSLAPNKHDDRANTQTHRPPELVLIRGKSGTGKTALANALSSRLQLDSGFFLSGKFDITSQQQQPYAVFGLAFTQLAEALEICGNENVRSTIREVIHTAVGNKEGPLLTSIIPALKNIISPQDVIDDDTCNVKGNEALHRFQFFFCKLCLAVSSVAPLVLFLDDLQWGDTASLQLLRSLLRFTSGPQAASASSSLLIIGAYREEGIGDHDEHGAYGEKGIGDQDEHTIAKASIAKVPFLSYLSQFHELSSSGQLHLTKIRLQNLDEASTNKLVAKFMQTDVDDCEQRSHTIFYQCQGNPFHALQILKSVKQDDPLQAVDVIKDGGIFSETMDELVRRKIASMPESTQKVLQIAAYLGDEIDESTISTVLDAKMCDIEEAIRAGCAEGHLVFDAPSGRYRFSHDRIRSVAMSLHEDQSNMAYQIGYLLWTRSYTDKIFVAANLLNTGIELMADPQERYRAAALNLEAGITAASAAAFPDASRYLSAGIEFLKGGDFWIEQYELSLSLFHGAGDAQFCIQNYTRALELVHEVLSHARTLHDQIPALVTKINCLGELGQISEAIKVGVDILHKLGEPFPKSATKRSVKLELFRAKVSLRGRSFENVLALPPMECQNKLAATQVLSMLLPYVYHGTKVYSPLMGARLVRLCLKYGLHKNCALGFVTMGWVLCASNRKQGFRYGTLAMSIIEKVRARELIPRVHMFFYAFIHHWMCPLRDSLEPLKNTVRVGMDMGDVEYAMMAFYFVCTHSLHSGMPLRDVEQVFMEGTQQMRLYQQDNMLKLALVNYQFIHNLTGRANDPMVLAGDVAKGLNLSQTTVPLSVQGAYYYLEANLAFRFGDYERAHELSEKRGKLSYNPFALCSFVVTRQTEALTAIARFRVGQGNAKRGLRVARQILKQMSAWSADCAGNALFRKYMLEAELKSLKPHNKTNRHIVKLYQKSIDTSMRGGYTQEAALASELTGDYMNRQGNIEEANNYWKKAHSLYLTWGATEKAAHLFDKSGLAELNSPRSEQE